jgi:hypothetical protein
MDGKFTVAVRTKPDFCVHGFRDGVRFTDLLLAVCRGRELRVAPFARSHMQHHHAIPLSDVLCQRRPAGYFHITRMGAHGQDGPGCHG